MVGWCQKRDEVEVVDVGLPSDAADGDLLAQLLARLEAEPRERRAVFRQMRSEVAGRSMMPK